MGFKNIVRSAVRKALGAREYETIGNTINRRKINISKIFWREKISEEKLKSALIDAGIHQGMNVFIHCSWRQFYNFEGNPEDVIRIIEELIGQEGTILMPAFGAQRNFLDVELTPSNAGVLSEVFRNQKNTLRSACTHFSVSARGKNAEKLLKDHFYSSYGFDEFSPMYKLAQMENSKILFLGLSKKPTTISLFHCAGYLKRYKSDFLKEKIFTEQMKTILIVDEKTCKKNMITRNPRSKNNKKVFRKIFSSLKENKQITISNLDIVTINAKEGLDKALDYTSKGIYCYKKNFFV